MTSELDLLRKQVANQQRELESLLALIFRDNGQHARRVGLTVATAQAKAIVTDLYSVQAKTNR